MSYSLCPSRNSQLQLPLRMVTAAMIFLIPWKESDAKLDDISKSRDTTLPTKVHLASSQSCGFSSSHVQMWELDHEKDWVLKNWCFPTVVLGKTPKSPLNSKEIKSVNPKGNQPWIFIGKTDAEAEFLILWPPDAKNWLVGKDPEAGKDWRQKKWAAEDDMVR